jgi:hypothetical protein
MYGAPVAVLTLGLLLFLRLNIGFDTGLPLQELAANLRYDLAPAPFLLAGVLLLQGGTSSWRAIGAGAMFGLATLMQFYGIFLLPIAALFLWSESRPFGERLRLIAWLVGAAALVGLPYGVYALAHADDFRGQAGTIDRRADFDRPGFYIDNLLDEPDRFLRPLAFREIPRGADHAMMDPQWLSIEETLTRRPSAKLAILVGLPAALAYSGWRALRDKSRGDRLLFLCLGGLVAEYALFESTKFYIYWIPVVPFLCIGIAAAALGAVRGMRPERFRPVVAVGLAAVLLLVFAEGGAARLGGIRAAPDATNYDQLEAEIHRYVPEGSRVVGSTALWWGLRDTDYRSYFLFFYKTRPDAGPYKTTISGFLDGFDAEYLVLTRLAIGELDTFLSPQDHQDWQAYMDEHATKVARIEGPVVIAAYGFIDIWRFDH